MNQTASTTGAPLGNQNAARAKLCREALRKELARKGGGDFDKGLAMVCKKVVSLACDGEQWAVQELMNRLDGRVAQGVELTGANGGELVVRDANTSMGIARRLAFVLAQGAMAKARASSKEEADAKSA